MNCRKASSEPPKKTEMGGREESPWAKGLYPISSLSAKEAARGRGHPGGNLEDLGMVLDHVGLDHVDDVLGNVGRVVANTLKVAGD